MLPKRSRPKCHDSRKCFAAYLDDAGIRRCDVLQLVSASNNKVTINGKEVTLKKGFYAKDLACPFCKPVKDVTGKKKYPYNPDYVGRG